MEPQTTRSIVVGPRSGMPKEFPLALKLRAVALLVELRNAEAAAAQTMREWHGWSVTGSSVIRWGAGLGVKLQAGRRKGLPGIVSRVSPWREKVAECAARGLTPMQALAELTAEAERAEIKPLSRQEVYRYWPRPDRS